MLVSPSQPDKGKRAQMSSGRTGSVVSSSPSFGRYSDEPVQLLQDAGLTVELVERGDTERLRVALRTADAWIAGFEPVDSTTLTDAPELKVAAKCGAGLDNFDLDYLRERGIAVVSVPGGNSAAVAEYAMAQVLALARGVAANDAAVRTGAWKPNVGMGLAGRTLGIVGFGAIGRRLAQLATAFDMRLIVADPFLNAASGAAEGVQVVELPALLATADVVSLHVPLSDATRHLIGEAELAQMQPHALLVNDSRGGIVDEQALARALAAGTIAGAAVDVFADEPAPPDLPLLSAPNLLVSPHTAGYSDSALATVTLTCARSILEALGS
jgi:phosphoglycerate dehydrogenase-like enzyme